MTKEEYSKASHFRDATKMVAAPGSLSGLFDTRLCFGYASRVDTVMVRRGLGGPNTLADSRLSFDGAAFLLAI